MKNKLLTLCICCLMVGCASIGTQQKWEEGKWVNEKRYICKGAGCEVDFKNETMKGGTYLPPIPLRID